MLFSVLNKLGKSLDFIPGRVSQPIFTGLENTMACLGLISHLGRTHAFSFMSQDDFSRLISLSLQLYSSINSTAGVFLYLGVTSKRISEMIKSPHCGGCLNR